MAKDGNTYAKRQRETLKRQKAEAKRDRRKKRKERARLPGSPVGIDRPDTSSSGCGRRNGDPSAQIIRDPRPFRRAAIHHKLHHANRRAPMIAFQTAPRLPRVSTCRQRSIRRRARRYSLQKAVRFAVDVCFRFSGRAVQVKALWSETERVWLGSKTFLDWSMWIENIDIPWAVATAAGRRRTLNNFARRSLSN